MSHWLSTMIRWSIQARTPKQLLFISRYYPHRCNHDSAKVPYPIPSTAPKPEYNLKHIRQNPEVHSDNCHNRNYKSLSENPAKIVALFEERVQSQIKVRHLRERNNAIQKELKTCGIWEARSHDNASQKIRELLEEAKGLKEKLSGSTVQDQNVTGEIESLAAELPNLTSDDTPLGEEPQVIGYINVCPDFSAPITRTHVDIGADLDILDFAGAATTSGWGWYYLKNEAALLEQALIQYALKIAQEFGFSIVTPPSMVYSHIVSACGFRPRDHSGEQQVYDIEHVQKDERSIRPTWSLAGTAEIPFAGMKAKSVFNSGDLPLKIVGPSRCYRAEAGARGADTKGLYRVHEFTKVEMFCWTLPGAEQEAFDSLLSVQKTILHNLGLHCRILEMPSEDLGASATRKQDIEAYFPSRRRINQNGDVINEGWGEVTSASICTDYQTRRLDTHVKNVPGSEKKMGFPSTVNGTAVAVPRVLAALLETGWDEKGFVRIPEVLWPWMHGIQTIQRKTR